MNAERYGAEKNKKNKKIREGVAPTVGCSLGGGVLWYNLECVFVLCGKYKRNKEMLLLEN